MGNFPRRAALLLAAATLGAQEAPVFRSDATLALVSFHVTRQHRYVTGLKPDDFVVLDDGVERAITLFESGSAVRRATPVDLSLVFDTSGSVTDNGLLDPLVFKANLLDGLPELRLAVYGFGRKLSRFCGPTRDVEILRAAFSALRDKDRGTAAEIPIALPPKRKADSRGATWLYEAIAGAAADAPRETTRMLLVFSDGLPSTTSEPEDAAAVCHDLGIPVYPVLLGHWELMKRLDERRARDAGNRNGTAPASSGTTALEAQEQEAASFARLGELTGGRSFDPPVINLQLMNSILTAMVAEVRTQYVAGISPPPSGGPPRKHKLEVRLRDKPAGTVIGGKRAVVY